MPNFKVEQWPIEKVKPYPKNPRRNERAVDAVANSIRDFGMRVPVVCDKNGVIITGHTRRLAAIKLGMKVIPVHIANISDVKANAYRLADNKTNELASWDFELLAEQIKELNLEDIDMSKFGFKEVELKELLGFDPEQNEKDNAIPEKAKPRTRVGQLWALGDHRLLVGDSSLVENWTRLLGDGESLDMVFTDPPYGVAYEGKTKEKMKIQNDEEEDLDKIVFPALGNAITKTKAGGCWYVTVPSRPVHIRFAQFLNERGVLRQILQWNKDAFVMGHSDYHYQHEPILYGWKPGQKHQEPETRNQTSVWNVARPKKSELHPTTKPLELVEKAIVNSSKKGWIVGDPFCGSGTTLIAAEKTGRRARVLELDTKYADVILQRWEDYTGKKAEVLK